MAITSTTSWAPGIVTETLNPLTLSYLRGAQFLTSLIRAVDLTGVNGLKHDFDSLGSLTAAATSQGTDLTPAALTVVEDGTVTAAEVGVAVEIARIALLAAGGSLTEDDIAREIANAIGAKLETDLCAKFADATNETGTTGVAMSLATFEDSILKMRQNNAPTVVPPNFNLPPQWAGYQFVGAEKCVADLARSIRQAGIPWMSPDATALSETLGSAAAAQMRGVVMGVKIYGSNYVATANAAADNSNAMFCPAAIGMVTKGGPTVETEVHTLGRSKYLVGSQIYGLGLIKNVFAVEVIAKA